MTISTDPRVTGSRGPRKRRALPARPLRDAEFINRELTTEEQIEYRQWREDVTAVVSAWGELCENGNRVNTKWDGYSSSFAAFIIPDDDVENAGFILTGRGGTPYRALAEAVFKHLYVFQGVWVGDDARRGREYDPEY